MGTTLRHERSTGYEGYSLFQERDNGWTVRGVAGRLHVVMANASSVHTTLESETLRIPELVPFIGKKVQIIVIEEEPVTADSGCDRPTDDAREQPSSPKRTLGSLRGSLQIPDDFDKPLSDDTQRAFGGDADD